MLRPRFGCSLLTAAAFTLAAVGVVCTSAGSETAGKELSRVRGSVSYAAQANSPGRPLFGSVELGDDQFAITKAKSLAIVRLQDSSVIEIGENTIVQIGAFHGADPNNPNVMTVNQGLVHFLIRHPEGKQANYQFTTPTSQIAVRGTEGTIEVTDSGTKVTLASGTVQITTGATVVSIGAGQSLSILGSTSTNAAVGGVENVNPTVATNATTATTTTGAAIGGSSLGTVLGAVGGLGTIGAIAKGASPAAPATPQPSPIPPGPIVVSGNGGIGQNNGTSNALAATLPSIVPIVVTQADCTTPLTIGATPAGAIGASPSTLSCVNGAINGSVMLTFAQYGSAQLVMFGSAQTFSHTQNLFGLTTLSVNGSNTTATSASPGTLSFNGVGSFGLTVSQPGPSAAVAVALSCPGTTAANYQAGASSPGIGLNTPGNFSVAGTGSLGFSLVVVSGPTYGSGGQPAGSGPPCQLLVTGSAGDQFTVPVNITSAGLTLQSKERKIEIVPGGRRPH